MAASLPRLPPLPRRAVLSLCACLLLFTPARPAHAQVSPPYEAPDLSAPLFDVNALGLDAPARARLAAMLAAGVTDFNAALDAKLLGLALRLDPASRPALAAAERRKRGELPDPKSGEPRYPAATVAAYLAGQSAGLRAKGGPDNLTLAGYLGAVAADLAPDDPVVKYEKTACAKNCPAPAWTFLRGKAATPAAPEAWPLLKKQSKIRGLGVSELASGERTGSVMEMIVTAEEAHSRDEVGVTTSRPVGDSMRIALDEAARAVRLRHPGFGSGQHLVLSFGDNYTNKDGPSGGTAFTLLLYSLYDPLRLAADCAVTGDMTVDGRVRAVGAVPSKIHAALMDGCRVVAVPKENARSVDDLPFLYPMNTLWKLQIFTVDTLDEALAVMREDRPADLQRAMDLFAAVQRRLGQAPGLSAANADLALALREILKLAPGHASAAVMLRALEGRAASGLSVYASMDEVSRLTHATLAACAPTRARPAVDYGALADGVNRLDALRPHLDYRVADLCTAYLAGLRALQGLDAGRTPAERSAEFRQRYAALREVERRMASDPALIEAMRH